MTEILAVAVITVLASSPPAPTSRWSSATATFTAAGPACSPPSASPQASSCTSRTRVADRRGPRLHRRTHLPRKASSASVGSGVHRDSSGPRIRRHRQDRPHLSDDVQPVLHELRIGDRPGRRVRVARAELEHGGVDMPAGQGVVQAEPVAQQRRAVGDLVGQVVATAPGAGRRTRGRGRRGVRPVVPPAGISVTDVLSYTGKRPVFAATISSYGRVVDVHCGCEAGSVTGTVSDRETFSLSGKPPRQAPLVRSTSNRPTRPWLTVVSRSRCGS